MRLAGIVTAAFGGIQADRGEPFSGDAGSGVDDDDRRRASSAVRELGRLSKIIVDSNRINGGQPGSSAVYTLDLYGDGLVQFSIDEETFIEIVGAKIPKRLTLAIAIC